MPFSPLEQHLDVCRELHFKIRTHQIYVDYPTTTAFVANAMKLVSLPDSVNQLMVLYNKVKAYRDWLEDDLAQQILRDDSIRDDDASQYTVNINAKLGKHPMPVDEADPITDAAMNLLIKNIKEKASAAYIEREKRDDAIDKLQDYVNEEMSRMYAGDYGLGEAVTEMDKVFNDNVTAALGDYVDEYETQKLQNAMAKSFDKNRDEILKLHEAGIASFRETGIGSIDFWSNMKSKYDMLTEVEDISAGEKIERAIMKTKEDPVEYAIKNIERNGNDYGIKLAIKDVRYRLVGINDVDDVTLFFPEEMMRIPFHTVEPAFYEEIRNFVDGILTHNEKCHAEYYTKPNYKELSKATKKLSPSVQEMIWKTWSEINATRFVDEIRVVIPKERTYNTMGDVVIKLYHSILELNLHPSIDKEALAIRWLGGNSIDELPTDDTGFVAVAKFVVTERYEDFCKSKGVVAKTTAVAKTSAFLATINSIVVRIRDSKSKLDEALNAENNSPREALDAAKGKFAELLNVQSLVTDFATGILGLNLGSALVAIPGFAIEAKNAIVLRKKAKKNLIEAEEELVAANLLLQDPLNVDIGNIEKKKEIESRIFALGVVLTKKLRQFIWDIVEILKRLMSICSAILKITGVGAVVGFSIDTIKAVINLIQQSYFLGRAIYKKYHGTKGVDRHAAADKFIADAFDHEQKYAAEIIIQTGANKGVIEQNLASMTHQDGFVQQIHEMKSNHEDIALASCRKAMNANLFKALSSKPQATLTRLLFPGSGFIKSVTGS